MSSTPTQVTTKYCSDEDCLVHAGTDYGLLAPDYQQLAYGQDGAFAAGALWTLTSATVDFEAQGVVANHVVWLKAPKGQYGSAGTFLAVDSVSGSSAVLRRPYKDLNVGQPPAPAGGLTAVTFNVLTFDPQITEATYDIQQRFSIDDHVSLVGTTRSSSFIYDLQVLRMTTVYWVLLERYIQESRSTSGDFAMKVKRFQTKLDDALGRVQVRWGPTGNSAEATTLFSCRISR